MHVPVTQGHCSCPARPIDAASERAKSGRGAQDRVGVQLARAAAAAGPAVAGGRALQQRERAAIIAAAAAAAAASQRRLRHLILLQLLAQVRHLAVAVLRRAQARSAVARGARTPLEDMPTPADRPLSVTRSFAGERDDLDETLRLPASPQTRSLVNSTTLS